ncbi:MAG: hypothetical protein AB7G93_04035 [Bdellovibrionales bacterium]
MSEKPERLPLVPLLWALAVTCVTVLVAGLPLKADETKPLKCGRLLITPDEPRSFLGRLVLPPAHISDLDGRFRFSEVATVALRLLHMYPASGFYFIGIGRSPFPFIDIMNLISPGSAATVPISYREYIGKKQFIPFHRWAEELGPFSRSREQTRIHLFRHLRRFIPTRDQLGYREMVILDFADNGRGLAKFSADLIAFLSEENRPVRHQLVFLSEKANPDELYLDQLATFILPESEFDSIMGPLAKYSSAFREFRPFHWYPEIEQTLRARLPRFRNIQLTDELKNLANLLTDEAFKPFAPYVHYVPDPSSRHYVEVLRSRRQHGRFQRVLQMEFNRLYSTSLSFRATIDAARASQPAFQP